MRHIVEAALAHYQVPSNKVGFDKARALCYYRTKDGHHCAIGCLFGAAAVQELRSIKVDSRLSRDPSVGGMIPFNLWDCGASIETISSNVEYEEVWNAIKAYLKVESPRGLILLQQIHDNVASSVEDPEKAREQLVLELQQVLSGNISTLRTYNTFDWDLCRKKTDLHKLL